VFIVQTLTHTLTHTLTPTQKRPNLAFGLHYVLCHDYITLASPESG